MDKTNTFVIFYQAGDMNINDAEKLVKTEKNTEFHMLFFHNKNLHFDKAVILREVLYKKFERVDPDTEYDNENNIIKLTKTLYFNLLEFDREVDDEYEKYLSKINYRIECIFQTFSLFFRIYKNENQIYIFPVQILDKFIKYLEKPGIKYTEVEKNNKFFKENEIIKNINASIKIASGDKETAVFSQKMMTGIFHVS